MQKSDVELLFCKSDEKSTNGAKRDFITNEKVFQPNTSYMK